MKTIHPRVKLAYCLRVLQGGETQKARGLLDRLSRETDDDPAIWNALGATCYELGDLEAAREALRRCVALEPEHPLANATLGEIALREKDGPTAVRHFETALRASGAGLEKMRQWVKILLTVAAAPRVPAATNEAASRPR